MTTCRVDIPGWPGYQVDTEGNVWSCRGHGKVTDTWRRLKPQRIGKYLAIGLCGGKGTKVTQVYVHRLVLQTFVGPCPDGCETIHKNDVQTDNRLSNLEWGTHVYNCKLRRENGCDKLGEERRHSKLISEQVVWVRENPDGLSQTDRARSLGVSVATVNDIVKGRTWRHLK